MTSASRSSPPTRRPGRSPPRPACPSSARWRNTSRRWRASKTNRRSSSDRRRAPRWRPRSSSRRDTPAAPPTRSAPPAPEPAAVDDEPVSDGTLGLIVPVAALGAAGLAAAPPDAALGRDHPGPDPEARADERAAARRARQAAWRPARHGHHDARQVGGRPADAMADRRRDPGPGRPRRRGRRVSAPAVRPDRRHAAIRNRSGRSISRSSPTRTPRSRTPPPGSSRPSRSPSRSP